VVRKTAEPEEPVTTARRLLRDLRGCRIVAAHFMAERLRVQILLPDMRPTYTTEEMLFYLRLATRGLGGTVYDGHSFREASARELLSRVLGPVAKPKGDLDRNG
jgi:hypothetical protein